MNRTRSLPILLERGRLPLPVSTGPWRTRTPCRWHLADRMLWNRLLWIGVAALIFVFAYFKFSFTEKATKAAPAEPESQAQPIAVGKPIYNPRVTRAAWSQAIRIAENPYAWNAGEHSFHHHHAGRRPQLSAVVDIERYGRLWEQHIAGQNTGCWT